MKHLSYILLAIAIAYLTFTVPAFADSATCQPIYGGGQTCVQVGNITVDKKVGSPTKPGVMLDNVRFNDDKFTPGSPVYFQIIVANTGNTKVSKVQVKDIFPPQYVDFSTGNGSYDANTRTLTFEFTDINPGEKRQENIVGKIASTDQLPAGITCVLNQATAKDMADTSNNFSHDSAELCIQKEVPAPTQVNQPGPVQQPGTIIITQPGTTTTMPSETKGGIKVFPPQKVITTAPSTGPEMLPLLALMPTGAFGFFLRKKSISS